MKLVYILIVLVVAASTLGCIGNKQAEPTGGAVPAQIASPAVAGTPGIDDPFGTEVDVAALDSMLADSNMNISLSDSI
jgi:hypothetical protein